MVTSSDMNETDNFGFPAATSSNTFSHQGSFEGNNNTAAAAGSQSLSSRSYSDTSSKKSKKSKKKKKKNSSSGSKSSAGSNNNNNNNYSQELFGQMMDTSNNDFDQPAGFGDMQDNENDGDDGTDDDAFGDFHSLDFEDWGDSRHCREQAPPRRPSNKSNVSSKSSKSSKNKNKKTSQMGKEQQEQYSQRRYSSRSSANEESSKLSDRSSKNEQSSRKSNGSSKNSRRQHSESNGTGGGRRNSNKNNPAAFHNESIFVTMPEEEDLFAAHPFDDPFQTELDVDDEDDEDDEEDFEDDCSIHSDITGLTGVFSQLQSTNGDDFSIGEKTDVPRIFFPNKTLGPHPILATSAIIVGDPAKQKLKAADGGGGVEKNVRFGTIEIRQYDRILTHNPSTIAGPSIGIGWAFTIMPIVPVALYEANRTRPPLPSSRLVLNRHQRESILTDLGYSQKELAAAVRVNTKARNQRRQTVHNVKAEKVEEVLEGAGKQMRRIFGLGSRKNKKGKGGGGGSLGSAS